MTANYKCDLCECGIDEEDAVFCQGCYDDLVKEIIDELETEIRDLRRERDEKK